MTWTVTTEAGNRARWTEAGLVDDVGTFLLWLEDNPGAEATPTGPFVASSEVVEEVPAWFLALAWAASEGGVAAAVPPESPESLWADEAQPGALF